MIENRIRPSTSYQKDRCSQLSQTVEKIDTYEKMLERYGGKPITIYFDQGNTLEINAQYIKGMKRCAFSFYADLRDQKLKELAKETLRITREKIAAVK